MTAAIWLVTLVMVVATDLLTGVLVGLGLSLVQALPALRMGPLRIQRGARPWPGCRNFGWRARPRSCNCLSSTRR